MSGRYFTRKKRINLQEKNDKSCRKKNVSGDKSLEAVSAEKPEEVASAVETEKDKSPGSPQSQTRSSSPELVCAICLSKLENKSFTDNCFHQFCFVCLLEWSKVKSECPLCKQPFNSIIHNVRSYEDFDQYHIQKQSNYADDQSGRRFRYQTTLSLHNAGHDYAQDQGQPSHRDSRNLFGFVENTSSGLTTRTNWRRNSQAATSDFRRRIYRNKLFVVDGNRHSRRKLRVRDISPAFFRLNPACTHRLVPWLNRELNALLHNHEGHTQFLLELILGLITSYELSSEEFYQHVFPFIGRNTRHFMHEFEHFAKSAYHMQAYDQHAIYEPQTEDIDSDSSSSYGSDVMIISSPRGSEHMPLGTDQPLGLCQIPMPPNVIACRSTTTSTLACMSLPSVSLPTMAFPTWLNSIAPSHSTRPSSPDPPHLDLRNLPPLLQQSLSTSRLDSAMPGPSWFDADTLLQLTSSGLQTVTGQVQSEVVVKSEEKKNETVTVRSSGHSDSNSDSGSTVIFVQYDKPWEDRSPIMVSTDDDDHHHCRVGMTQFSKAKKKSSDSSKSSKLHKVKHDKDFKRTRINQSESQHSNRNKQRSKSRSHSRSSQCKSRKYWRAKPRHGDSRSWSNSPCRSRSSSRSTHRYTSREKSAHHKKHLGKEKNGYHEKSGHKSGFRSRSGERSWPLARPRSWSRTRYVSRLHSGGSLCVSFVASHRYPEHFSKSRKRSTGSVEYADHQNIKRSKKSKDKKHKKRHKKQQQNHDGRGCDSEPDSHRSNKTGKKQSTQSYKKHPSGHKNSAKKSDHTKFSDSLNDQQVLRRILVAGQSTANVCSDPRPEEQIIQQNDSNTNSRQNIRKESKLIEQSDVKKNKKMSSKNNEIYNINSHKTINTNQSKWKNSQNPEIECEEHDLLTDHAPSICQLVSDVQALNSNQQTSNTLISGNHRDKILKKSSKKCTNNPKGKKPSSSKHPKRGSKKHYEKKSEEHSNTLLKVSADKSSDLLGEKSSGQLQEEYMDILQIWKNLSKQQGDVNSATDRCSSVTFPVVHSSSSNNTDVINQDTLQNTTQSQKLHRSSDSSNASPMTKNKRANNEKTNTNGSKPSKSSVKICTGKTDKSRNTSFEKYFTHTNEQDRKCRKTTDHLQAESVAIVKTRQNSGKEVDVSSNGTKEQITSSNPNIDSTHLNTVSNTGQKSALVNFRDCYFDMFEEISDDDNLNELCGDDITAPAFASDSLSPRHIRFDSDSIGHFTSSRSKRTEKCARSDISEGEILSDSDQDSDVHVIRGKWNVKSKPIDIGSSDTEEEGELNRNHDILQSTSHHNSINRPRSITIGSSSSDRCPENNTGMQEKETVKVSESRKDFYESISIISSDAELSDGEIVDDTDSKDNYVASTVQLRKLDNYSQSACVLNSLTSNVEKSNANELSDHQSTEESRQRKSVSNMSVRENTGEVQINSITNDKRSCCSDFGTMSEHRHNEDQITAKSYVFRQNQMKPMNLYSDEYNASGISNLLFTNSEKSFPLVNEKVTDTENEANSVSSPVSSLCEASHSDDTESYSIENNHFETTNPPSNKQVDESSNVENLYTDQCSDFASGVSNSAIEPNFDSENFLTHSNSKDGHLMEYQCNTAESPESNIRTAFSVGISSDIGQDPSVLLLNHIFEQSDESDKEVQNEKDENYSHQEIKERVWMNDSYSKSTVSRTDSKGTKYNSESEMEKIDEKDLKTSVLDRKMSGHNSDDNLSESEEKNKCILGKSADSDEEVYDIDTYQNIKSDVVESEKMSNSSSDMFVSNFRQSSRLPASCDKDSDSCEGDVDSRPICSYSGSQGTSNVTSIKCDMHSN